MVRFNLPKSSYVALKVYNLLGQEVVTLVDAIQDAGYKSVTWDANRISGGVYFYRLTTGTFTDVKKMLLVK